MIIMNTDGSIPYKRTPSSICCLGIKSETRIISARMEENIKTMLMSMKHALLLCLVTTVCSYRTGAPGSDIVCRAMFPVGHGHEAQAGPAPYTISVSTTVFFDAYDKVQGTLS